MKIVNNVTIEKELIYNTDFTDVESRIFKKGISFCEIQIQNLSMEFAEYTNSSIYWFDETMKLWRVINNNKYKPKTSKELFQIFLEQRNK